MHEGEGRHGEGRPIWEMELIISGAVIFGLFQIPPALTDWFSDVAIHLSASAYWVPYFAYYLGVMATVGLILVFCAHFAVRCLWVSVLGLHKAFPQGIDWDRIDLGPLQRRFFSGRLTSIADLEPALDRLASSLFAMLFVVLAYVVMVGLVVAVGFSLAWMLARWLPALSQTQYFFIVTFGGMALPMTVSAVLIQWTDSRMKQDPGFEDRHPRTVAVAERMLRWTSAAVGARFHQPVVLLLRSRISNTRFLVVSNLLVLMFVVVVVVVMLISMGALRGDSYRYFPDRPGALGYDPDHYNSRRDAGSPSDLPWIQDEVIERPLLRLFLPFRARNGNTLVAEQCPELQPFHGDGLRLSKRPEKDDDPDRVEAALTCLTSLYQVGMNGEPLDLTDVLFAEDARTDVKGLLVMVTEPGLRKGRNQLVVTRTEKAGLDAEQRQREFHIPFWYLPASEDAPAKR